MREYLENILRLADDQSYSHAARMVEIKREAKKALDELLQVQAKTSGGPKAPAPAEVKVDGGKAGNTPKEQTPPKADKVII